MGQVYGTGEMMKRFVAMWIRYNDWNLECHEDRAHAFSKRFITHKVAVFFSKVREYVGSCFPSEPYDPEGPSPYPEGSFFNAILHRHKKGRVEPDGIFRESPPPLQPRKTW